MTLRTKTKLSACAPLAQNAIEQIHDECGGFRRVVPGIIFIINISLVKDHSETRQLPDL